MHIERRPSTAVVYDRAPRPDQLRRRKEAERLLENPEFRNVQVSEMYNIPGIKWDITVDIGPLPTLGGWRIASAPQIKEVYNDALAGDTQHIAGIVLGEGVPDDNDARAGVLEAWGLATDMALKWAGMRATMKYARDHQPDVYPAPLQQKETIDTWIDSSQLSGGKSVAVSELANGDKITGLARRNFVTQHAEHIRKFNDEKGEGKAHITAPDMGTTMSDMTAMHFLTPDVASMAPEYGGSGDPSPTTALGVYHGITAMLDFMGKNGDETKFSIQGAAGEVGSRLLKHVRERFPDATLIISDMEVPDKQQELARLAKDKRARIVHGDQIFQQGGIFVPSGPSAQLNEATHVLMKEAKVEAVIGPANSLYPPGKEKEMAEMFHQDNILVAPAPLVNQGGIRNITAGEFVERHGGQKPSPELIAESIADVGPMLTHVLKRSQNEMRNPDEVFREIAVDEFAELLVTKGILR